VSEAAEMAEAGVARGSGLVSFALAAPFVSLSVFIPFFSGSVLLLRLGLRVVVITAKLVGGR
jgi:hypothetical protein